MFDVFDKILNIITHKEFYGVILVLGSAFILYKILITIANKFISSQKSLEAKRRNTFIKLGENIIKYILIIISLFIILGLFGFDTTALIAGVGIVGLVIGLGLQDTIKDFISGITILVDDFFVVGDTIELRGFKGEVISLGLRTTKVKKNTGEIQTFANRAIDMVINYSQKSSKMIFEITVPYNTDEKVVEKILKSLKLADIKNIDEGECEYLGIKGIVDAGVVHLYQIKCGRIKISAIRSETILLIKKAFDEKNIKITLV